MSSEDKIPAKKLGLKEDQGGHILNEFSFGFV